MSLPVVLVGQAPSRVGDPARPLEGSAGRRLAKIAGLDYVSMLAAFERRNVLSRWPGKGKHGDAGDSFPVREARAAGAELARSLVGRDVVALGARVALALGCDAEPPPYTWVDVPTADGPFRLAVVPHPSGVNRHWNDQRNVKRARAFLRDLVERSRAAGGGPAVVKDPRWDSNGNGALQRFRPEHELEAIRARLEVAWRTLGSKKAAARAVSEAVTKEHAACGLRSGPDCDLAVDEAGCRCPRAPLTVSNAHHLLVGVVDQWNATRVDVETRREGYVETALDIMAQARQQKRLGDAVRALRLACELEGILGRPDQEQPRVNVDLGGLVGRIMSLSEQELDVELARAGLHLGDGRKVVDGELAPQEPGDPEPVDD